MQDPTDLIEWCDWLSELSDDELKELAETPRVVRYIEKKNYAGRKVKIPVYDKPPKPPPTQHAGRQR